MENKVYEKLMKCYESIQAKIDFKPEVALVLGSGLGDYGNDIDVRATLPYSEIEGFPVSTVPGHEGKFLFGYVGKTPVVCMQGRVHYYEGYAMSDVVLPTRLMALMGAKVLFLTNAAGGINVENGAGSLMMITDQISSFVPSPLIGANLDKLGPRFPDMSEIYTKDIQKIMRAAAEKVNVPLAEGVYCQFTGPAYESPAEVRLAAKLGADAVGMSTTVEAVAGRHAGMKVCGISCITNLAAGLSDAPLDHKEVQETANRVASMFKKLVTEILVNLHDYLQ